MIDYATEVIPGEKASGYKDLKADEWFFKVHWPNDPNMPGMLQIEFGSLAKGVFPSRLNPRPLAMRPERSRPPG